MHGLHSILPDLLTFKRQLSSHQEPLIYDDIHKKIKLEEDQYIIENIQTPQPLRKPSQPFLPALSHHTSDIKTEGLQSLLLLNRANLIQQYLQLLSLSNLAQQQRKLLEVQRENSCNSATSYSTAHSLSPLKPPQFITEPSQNSSLVQIPKLDEPYLQKKGPKVSACKNYIALLCTGFARSILTADTRSEIVHHLNIVMFQKRAKYPSLTEKGVRELQELIIDHISQDICGKKVKKSNKGRDFKVRNTEELEELLAIKEDDNELVKFRKEVMKEMFDYFFESKYYMEWLDRGMINEINKTFFLKNKSEIQKKFNNPMQYKPHFDYNPN